MKKYKLRKWVEVVLILIGIVAFVVMASDCEDMMTFIISHFIASGIFILDCCLLEEYAR